MKDWGAVRDRMVEAFAEIGVALQQCRTEDDLLLVLELAEHYPEMARNNLVDPAPLPTALRIDAMRAAVRNMRTAVINPHDVRKSSYPPSDTGPGPLVRSGREKEVPR